MDWGPFFLGIYIAKSEGKATVGRPMSVIGNKGFYQYDTI